MSTGYSLVGANAQDEGSNLGFGSYFNFTGAGVTASISGNVVTVDIPGGGAGGTPALPFSSIQYNNAGAFGGSANFTWSGSALVVSNGAGVTDTLSPGSLLFTTTGTAVISVKTAAAIDAPLNLDILDLQVNGASGLAGQVLTSGGPAASPTWSPVPAASGWIDSGTVVYLATPSDDVSIGSNTPVTNRKLSVYNGGTDLGISVVTLASTDNVIETFVTGEANLRWNVDGAGATRWGPGGAAVTDTRLRRSAANTLALDNGGAGGANFVPGTDLTGSLGTSTNRWTDSVATTHRVFATAGGANPDASLSATAVQFGAGGASALDFRLRRSAAASMIIDNNVGGAVVLSILGTTIVQRFIVGQSTTAASPYNVSVTDTVVFANPGAAQTINLPAAAASVAGRLITVKRVNTSANVVTVATLGGTLDGVATRVLAGGTYDSITVSCDGTNWWII